MQLFFYSLFLLAIIYSLFILWCWRGWVGIKEFKLKGECKTSVSVIVPARNEEKNITATLHDLINQNYPKQLFEIIVVNDHSTDGTVDLINQFIREHDSYNIRLLDLAMSDVPVYFKKNAITQAIQISNGELIITTDADCRRGEKWLSAIAGLYEEKNSLMISAPVKYSGERNWFEKIQSLEFSGLVAIGAGAINNLQPLLCNGANLAFTKEIFNKVNGYKDNRSLTTGDDTQLLLKISRIDKGRIHFLKSADAIVATEAKALWRELFSQRRRWASKVPVQMNALAIFIGMVAWLLHAGLLSGLILLFNGFSLEWLVVLFLIKIMSEFLLLNSIAAFIKKKKLVLLLLPAQFWYMVYVAIVGMASLFGKYEWKKRRTR